VAAAALATMGLLLAGEARAGAALLPTAPPTPASLPVQLPAPTPVPAPAPVNQVPVAPVPGGSQPPSGGPASAGGEGGGADPAASQATPAYAPPPSEQAALPPEPQRYVLEALQAQLAGEAAGMDQQDGPEALAAGGGSGVFAWPIVFSRRPPITQPFGCTDVPGEPHSPTCATHRLHTGIDLGVPTRTPILAAATGVAHLYRTAGGYGNYILITHGNGWFTLYGHLSEFVVPDGQVIRRGQPIACSGSTGFSSGPHLHFEIRRGQTPLDPCAYLCR
jgi:murein DD-endopeptidase MepM/ murein hydrolase activator NlpD